MNRLKQITTKAKALYKSGKYAKWTDAIKAASKQTATVGATKKKTAVKKSAPKKKAAVKSYHKDSKSHNVRISVMSGLEKDLENKLKNAIHFLGITKSNIDFEKLMIKKDPMRKNYWKLKMKESQNKLKKIQQIVNKLKKVI
jgi:hypothetical protein